MGKKGAVVKQGGGRGGGRGRGRGNNQSPAPSNHNATMDPMLLAMLMNGSSGGLNPAMALPALGGMGGGDNSGIVQMLMMQQLAGSAERGKSGGGQNFMQQVAQAQFQKTLLDNITAASKNNSAANPGPPPPVQEEEEEEEQEEPSETMPSRCSHQSLVDNYIKENIQSFISDARYADDATKAFEACKVAASLYAGTATPDRQKIDMRSAVANGIQLGMSAVAKQLNPSSPTFVPKKQTIAPKKTPTTKLVAVPKTIVEEEEFEEEAEADGDEEDDEDEDEPPEPLIPMKTPSRKSKGANGKEHVSKATPPSSDVDLALLAKQFKGTRVLGNTTKSSKLDKYTDQPLMVLQEALKCVKSPPGLESSVGINATFKKAIQSLVDQIAYMINTHHSRSELETICENFKIFALRKSGTPRSTENIIQHILWVLTRAETFHPGCGAALTSASFLKDATSPAKSKRKKATPKTPATPNGRTPESVMSLRPRPKN